MAEAYTALDPDFLKKVRSYMNQRQLTTGIAPRPDDIQAFAEAELQTNAQAAVRDRATAERKREFDLSYNQQQDAIKRQQLTGMVSGGANILTGAATTYGVGKSLGWWGAQAPASEAAVTAAGTNAASAAAAAPITDAALIGETGGYVGAGTQAAGAGASTISSVLPPVAAALAIDTGLKKVTGRSFYENVGHAYKRVGEGISKVVKGDTIICTELHRQGIFTDRQRRYGMMYGKQVGEEVCQGYLLAAAPVVERMRRSKSYTRFVAFFAIPAIREIAHRIDPRVKGSIFGSLVLHFGVPVCLKAYDKHTSPVDSEVRYA